jgi:hypothetical protein
LIHLKVVSARPWDDLGCFLGEKPMRHPSVAVIPAPARAFMAFFLSTTALVLALVLSVFAILASVLLFSAGTMIFNVVILTYKVVVPMVLFGLVVTSGLLCISRSTQA